jgi:hypothetical protein
MNKFRGVVGGVTYTEPALFERSARARGYLGMGKRQRVLKWKIGTPVGVKYSDGTRVEGQVWSRSDKSEYVWVALDDGTYALVSTRSGLVYNQHGGTLLGKVAA